MRTRNPHPSASHNKDMGLMSRIVAWSIGGSIAYASYYTGVWTLNSRESKTNYNQLRDMLRPEIEYNQMKATPYHKMYMNPVIQSSAASKAGGVSTMAFKGSWNEGVDKVFNYISRL